MPPNADPKKTANNIILEHIPTHRAYHNLFDSSVREFNARQIKSGHAERVIKNYYDTIKHDSKKHTAYEIIIQIGGHADGGAPEQSIDALIQYTATWQQANPNLYCIGAYIHMDETTPHAHIDYIPVAECKRGMKTQNSLNQALKSMGFTSHGAKNTAQMAWEQSERERMRTICKKLGIELREQGTGRKRHLTVDEYKEVQNNINAAKQNLAVTLSKQIQSEFETEASKKELTSKQTKIAQLDAAISKRQSDINQLDAAISKRQSDINQLDAAISKRQSDINQLDTNVNNQQSIINLLKQQTKKEKNTLEMLRDTIKTRLNEKENLSSDIANLIMNTQNLQNKKEQICKDIAAKKIKLNEINEILESENGDFIHMIDNFYWLIRDAYPDIADYAENEIRQHLLSNPELDYNDEITTL